MFASNSLRFPYFESRSSHPWSQQLAGSKVRRYCHDPQSKRMHLLLAVLKRFPNGPQSTQLPCFDYDSNEQIYIYIYIILLVSKHQTEQPHLAGGWGHFALKSQCPGCVLPLFWPSFLTEPNPGPRATFAPAPTCLAQKSAYQPDTTDRLSPWGGSFWFPSKPGI